MVGMIGHSCRYFNWSLLDYQGQPDIADCPEWFQLPLIPEIPEIQIPEMPELEQIDPMDTVYIEDNNGTVNVNITNPSPNPKGYVINNPTKD